MDAKGKGKTERRKKERNMKTSMRKREKKKFSKLRNTSLGERELPIGFSLRKGPRDAKVCVTDRDNRSLFEPQIQ